MISKNLILIFGILLFHFYNEYFQVQAQITTGLQIPKYIGVKDYLRETREKPSLDNEYFPKFPLPRTLEPLNYNITIKPIMDNFPEDGEQFTAPGQVRIIVNCLQNTNVITLHAFLLEINNETTEVIDKVNGNVVSIINQTYEADKHFYNINLQSQLLAGSQYEISMEFVAPVSLDRVNGLYLATYTDPASGEIRRMAATQLEPARARQIFPSFDEPRWKPTFDVIIGRRSNYTTLCNSPPVDSRQDNLNPNWFWDYYNTTVPMPTYLFAMAVSDYSNATADSSLYRVPVKTYAAKYLIDNGLADYSAEVSAKIINYFEELYDVEYPMPKVDSILVPGKGGAMENYGLITYGDFLMYDASLHTEAYRQRLVNIISHELAHQWFGNLVTCVSWSHIYLNEGFATYVSYIGEEPFHNEFFPRKYILNDAVQNAYQLDAGPTSHPLVVEDIYTIPDISAHFSNLQYDKGSSLIRMMEGFLGESILNSALRKYIQGKLHDVAEQDELFEYLDNEVPLGTFPGNLTVKCIMDTWTLKNRFPLVRVSYWDASNVYISQETFVNRDQILNVNSNSNKDDDDLWEIPITIATARNPNFQNYTPSTWMHKNVAGRIVQHDTSNWIMINLDGMNFHRVLYDDRLSAFIFHQLRNNYSVISPLSRSQFLDDYLNLAWQGYLNIETALSVTEYFAQESDFTVWNAFFTNFRSPFILLRQSNAAEATKSYFLPRIEGALQTIGFRQNPNDKGALVLLRAQLLDWACAMNHDGCQEYANDLLSDWQADPTPTGPFPLDLQPVLYCSAIANGSDLVLNFFTARYLAATSDIHKSRLAAAIGCITSEALIDRILESTLNSTYGWTKSDSVLILIGLSLNGEAQAKLFAFIRTRIQDLITFHGSASPIANVIASLSTYYSTNEELNQVQTFINDNFDALIDVQSILETALKTIERNILWQARFYERIKSWLEIQTSKNL